MNCPLFLWVAVFVSVYAGGGRVEKVNCTLHTGRAEVGLLLIAIMCMTEGTRLSR